MRQRYFIRKIPIPSNRSFSLKFNGFWYWEEIKGYGRWVCASNHGRKKPKKGIRNIRKKRLKREVFT